MSNTGLIFATYCESKEAPANACRLAESIRTFGGIYRESRIRAYIPEHTTFEDINLAKEFKSLRIEKYNSRYPKDATGIFYAGKPFAAAQAEDDASGNADVLVWVDDDAVVLNEPAELDLAADISLAYKPVMHNRAGSLYANPPDKFWARIYEILNLDDDLLFPMITPADRQQIRAYFHCGLAAVRPELGVFMNWARDFETLYRDSGIMKSCRENRDRRIFLHQHALTGAILRRINKEDMKELSDGYNYPIFFERQYEAIQSFNSIEEAVIIRCLFSPEKIGPDYFQELIGPRDKIEWLRERL